MGKKLYKMGENIASKELRMMHDDLCRSQRALQQLYEESWKATSEFKTTFNEIRQAENDTELLRQKYYEMLETRGEYKETDRDEYFEMERKLWSMKDRFIMESQKLAHGNSNYIAHSNQFSEEREKYILSMLEDVDKYYVANTRLSTQKSELETTTGQLGREIASCKDAIAKLTFERNKLLDNEERLRVDLTQSTERGNALSDECDRLGDLEIQLRNTVKDLKDEVSVLTAEIEELSTKTENLTEEVHQYEQQETLLKKEIEQRKKEQKQMEKEIKSLKAKSAELTKQKNNYFERNRRLTQKVAACRMATEKVEEQRDLFKEAFKQIKKEKNEIAQSCEKIKKEKDKFKERYLEMQSERQVVGKHKDRLVAREHRIKQQNEDMTMAHKYLVKELEDLKITYRKSEDRAKKDVKLKQDLRDIIKRLHKEMEEERKRMQKVTKDVKIQTDSDLAFENRDIVVLHAKLKLSQALKERDRALKETKQRQTASR